MKALLLEGARRLSLVDRDAPEARAGESLVTVEVAGIGGSEYLGYRAPGIRSLPNIMGHGFAGYADGRRVAVNPVRGCDRCAWCNRGERQLCDGWNLIGVQSHGGFAEQSAVPSDALVTLPDSLSWEQAAFVEPFANAINAWTLSGATRDSRVAVLGAGSLGLGLLARGAEKGCKDLAASDPSGSRFAAAAQLGARDIDSDRAYDVVFDTVGSSQTRHLALALARKRGTCVWMGFAAPSFELQAGELIRSQKTIIGAFAYSAEQFAAAVGLAHRAQDAWVTNLAFEAVEAQLQAYLAGDFSTLKAVLRPAI